VTKEPYERLERNASKVARFVLRRARPGNRSGLSDVRCDVARVVVSSRL